MNCIETRKANCLCLWKDTRTGTRDFRGKKQAELRLFLNLHFDCSQLDLWRKVYIACFQRTAGSYRRRKALCCVFLFAWCGAGKHTATPVPSGYPNKQIAVCGGVSVSSVVVSLGHYMQISLLPLGDNGYLWNKLTNGRCRGGFYDLLYFYVKFSLTFGFQILWKITK